MYLSRFKLRNSASINALVPLLSGRGVHESSNHQNGHHLVWSLFADSQDRKRDFLWHEIKTGDFYALSERLPIDNHDLFELSPPKRFSPSLRPQQKVGFLLRANPVVRKPTSNGNSKSKKHDIVMNAMHAMSSEERPANRQKLIRELGINWMEKQGARNGFELSPTELKVDRYEQHRIRRTQAPLTFSTLDISGYLTVSDPELFLAGICRGFGASKAFGCGLMLIRRP